MTKADREAPWTELSDPQITRCKRWFETSISATPCSV